MSRAPTMPTLRPFTVFVRFPNTDVEEIDVKAQDAQHARELAAEILVDEYTDAGGEIFRVVERGPGSLYL